VQLHKDVLYLKRIRVAAVAAAAAAAAACASQKREA